MNIVQRCRIFTLGLVLWIVVVATGQEHLAFSAPLGGLHAGIAGLVMGLALMPRRSVRWR